MVIYTEYEKKSIYHRKYHIESVINSISGENDVQLTYSQRNLIYIIFIEIDGILHKVNDGRKRIKFIIMQLFKMLGLPYKYIQVTKSNSKLKDYEQYWEKVQLLIGDRIQSIINK